MDSTDVNFTLTNHTWCLGFAGISRHYIQLHIIFVIVQNKAISVLQNFRLEYNFLNFFSEWIPLTLILLITNHAWCLSFAGISRHYI